MNPRYVFSVVGAVLASSILVGLSVLAYRAMCLHLPSTGTRFGIYVGVACVVQMIFVLLYLTKVSGSSQTIINLCVGCLAAFVQTGLLMKITGATGTFVHVLGINSLIVLSAYLVIVIVAKATKLIR